MTKGSAGGPLDVFWADVDLVGLGEFAAEGGLLDEEERPCRDPKKGCVACGDDGEEGEADVGGV